jgi:hypothetical protein
MGVSFFEGGSILDSWRYTTAMWRTWILTCECLSVACRSLVSFSGTKSVSFLLGIGMTWHGIGLDMGFSGSRSILGTDQVTKNTWVQRSNEY